MIEKFKKIKVNVGKREISVKYRILNPGGNMTALVEGIDYTKEERKIINDSILSKNSDVEQVGFLDREEMRLEMAGGEFCVNATRCAIFELLNYKVGEISLSVSGNNEKVNGGIKRDNVVYANIKLNQNISSFKQKYGKYQLIMLDGITLLILNEKDSKCQIKALKEDREETMKKLKEEMEGINTSSEALGIILLEEIDGITKINPVIWVKTIDTLYYETACGSGSLATAIYLYLDKNIESVKLLQPSGYFIKVTLNVKRGNNNEVIISDADIEGNVQIVE